MPPQPSDAPSTSPLVDTRIGAYASDDLATTTLSLSYTRHAWRGRTGRIVVLRVVGEIDHLTEPTLHNALSAALFGATDEPTSHVVVDLSGVTFCSVQGFSLLARMAVLADAGETGFAVSGCSTHLERCWRFLETTYPDAEHRAVVRHISTASAVFAARADRRTCLD